MQRLEFVEQSAVSPDGLEIALRLRLSDGSEQTLVVDAAYANTFSLTLATAARDARAERDAAEKRGALVSQPVGVDELRALALAEVIHQGRIEPVLYLDLVSGARVSVRLTPQIVRSFVERLSLATDMLERETGPN